MKEKALSISGGDGLYADYSIRMKKELDAMRICVCFTKGVRRPGKYSAVGATDSIVMSIFFLSPSKLILTLGLSSSVYHNERACKLKAKFDMNIILKMLVIYHPSLSRPTSHITTIKKPSYNENRR